MKKKRKNKKNIRIFIILLLAVICVFAVVKNIHLDAGVDIVCIDAGHGGGDAGAVNGSRFEKDDNLRLALKVRKELEAKGITVILTRDGDEFVELKDRCKTANRKRCDLFVSIHRNSSENGTGAEAWIESVAGAKESSLAKDLLEGICGESGYANRGVKRGFRGNGLGNYYVNSGTKMPSVLLEVGFISNEKDNELFDENLDKNAKAIAEAIAANLR